MKGISKRISLISLALILLFSVGCTCNVVGDKAYLNCYGSIVPCAPVSYNIGSPTAFYANGYFSRLYTDNVNTYIDSDALGNMTFTDAVSGTQTLAALLAGGGSGNVTGAGTNGIITKWTSASSIGNASITDAQALGAVNNSHTQNADWILTYDGVNPLISSGTLVYDLKTDRWVLSGSNTNTFLGIDVVGNDDITHAGGGSDATYNTAIGYSAEYDITSGYYNTAVGSFALTNLTTGVGNVAVGENSLSNVSTTSFNTAIGTDALTANTGSYNTAIGIFAGTNNTGSSNVFIGKSAGEDSGAESNKLYIDNSDDTTPLIAGDFSTDKVTINEDLDVADDATIVGTLSLSGDAIIKTDSSSARDLTITTGAQKTIVLSTPVYEDLQITMANVRTPASNAPNWVAYKGTEVPAFSKTATNVLYFSAQLPHSYKEGSDIEFHIHITYPDAGAGNSVWYFTYSWANIDGTYPAPSNSGNVVVPSHSAADFHDMAQIMTTINGAGKTVSSVLLCSIARIGGDGSDTYDNVIYLSSGDFHFQRDTMGSRQQLIK